MSEAIEERLLFAAVETMAFTRRLVGVGRAEHFDDGHHLAASRVDDLHERFPSLYWWEDKDDSGVGRISRDGGLRSHMGAADSRRLRWLRMASGIIV